MLDHLWELLNRALRRIDARPGSEDAARQRLHMVLVQDRFALPTETLEAMKNDLVNVISKYVVIDQKSIEVDIKRSAGAVVLVTNIPITDVQRGAAASLASPNKASG